MHPQSRDVPITQEERNELVSCMMQQGKRNDAALWGVQSMTLRQEFVGHTVQSWWISSVASRDVNTMSKREECASHMVPRWSDAALRVEGCVLIKPWRVDFVSCMDRRSKVKRKWCSSGGCTKYIQGGGVCITHGAKRERNDAALWDVPI